MVFRRKQLELAVDRPPRRQWIAFIDLRGVDQMNQQICPHHVTQKLMPQSVAFVSAFDETWDVRNDKTFSFVITDHA